MILDKFIFLLFIIIIGYLPYKLLQRRRPEGLNGLPIQITISLAVWFVFLSRVLILSVEKVNISITAFTFIILVPTIISWFMAPFIIRKIGIEPKDIIQNKRSWFIVRFDPATFYLKFLEVIFQQVKFVYMIFAVLIGLSVFDQIIWFTLIIAFFHFNNLFFLPKREALLFFFLSFPMGVLFSYLIINGYLFITISIHLWFYLLFAGSFWLRKNQASC
jgi:hypothetical protein